MVVYSGSLTTGQQTAVNEYLEAKWLGTASGYVVGDNLLPSSTPVSLTAVGATLNIGYDQTIASLSGVAGSTVNQEAGTLTVGGDNSSTTFAGSLNGGGGLVKQGGGTLTLSGNNSYSGATTVCRRHPPVCHARFALQRARREAGPRRTSPWPTAATLAVNVGGPSDFQPADVTNLLTGLDGAVNNNGLQAGSSIGFDTTNATLAVTLSNNIADTTGPGGGAVGVAKLGPGTLILTGSNTYSGRSRGTLQIGNGDGEHCQPTRSATRLRSALRHADYSGAISGGGGWSTTGPRHVDPPRQQHLHRADDGQRAARCRSATAASGEGLASEHHDEQQRHRRVQSRRPALLRRRDQRQRAVVKLGTGVLDLSGTSTYSGPTTISAGTLELDGNGEQPADGDGPDHRLRRRVGPGRRPADGGQPERLGRGDHHEPLLPVVRLDVDGGPVLRLTTTFAGNIIGNDALALSGSGQLTLSGTNTLHRRDDGQRRHAGHRRPQRVVRQRVGDDRRRRAAGFGSGAGIGALLAASSPVGSDAVALSAAASAPATIGGYESSIWKHGDARRRSPTVARRWGKRRRRFCRGRARAGNASPCWRPGF